MLVDQTLDPMISAYFKNIGQTKTLIELIQERNEIQAQSSKEMQEKFGHYNLELEEVLIGTPASPKVGNEIETILTQLRSRQIAREQLQTYETQQKAAEKEKELREAEAVAKQQTTLTESDINIMIQENQGKAELMKARQDAEKIQKLSEADAYKVKKEAEAEAFKIKVTAEAEADKEARVGISKAIAAKEQVNAYGGPQYKVVSDVMTSFANAVKEGKIDIVPKTLVSTGSNTENGGANAFESLIMLLLSEKFTEGEFVKETDEPEQIKKIKDEIMTQILNIDNSEIDGNMKN